MNEMLKSTVLNRRQFLKSLGAAAGGLLAIPLVHPQTVQAASRASGLTGQADRIGVIAPAAGHLPGLSGSFLAGMHLYFDQSADTNARLLLRTTTSQGSAVRGAALHLLDEDRVDGVVVFTSAVTAEMIRPDCEERGVPLALANLGENEQGDGAVHSLTAGAWQASRSLGNWAAAHLGKTALVAASLYDSGYDTLYAFRHGFEAAGGQVADTMVTHLAPQQIRLGELMSRIKDLRPDLVYAQYCGQAALDFARAYQSAGLAGKIPLVGSAFLATDEVQRSYAAVAEGLISATAWSPVLDLDENRAFCTAYEAQHGQQPDPVAVLGFETAWLVEKMLQAGGSPAAQAWVGPGGLLEYNPMAHCAVRPFYLQQLTRVGQDLSPRVLETLDSQQGVCLLDGQVKSGWTNCYLSI